MCQSNFVKIFAGGIRSMMILCREEDFQKVNKQDLIKKAFPELLEKVGWVKRFLLKIGLLEFGIKVESCYKMYPSGFDRQISNLEDENNWKEIPFYVLRLYKEKDTQYCSATALQYNT